MDQFWSPSTNTLDAPFGGAMENRVRFTLEVIKAIRARVGKEFILGVRGVADEVRPGGLTADEGLGIARYLAKSGMVDFLNIIRGHIDTDAAKPSGSAPAAEVKKEETTDILLQF
jgi:2,4-dienoyl-CoA reductase-like NADH-dependent reductase (Old Yellow Enzyme family)